MYTQLGINIDSAVAGKFVNMVCYFIILFLYSSIINLLFNYPLKLQKISVRITQIGLGVSGAHGETYDTPATEKWEKQK